jgi:hypothetical protein
MSAIVSQTYTLAYLVKHPASKEIVLKHLSALGIDEERLSRVDATLSALMDNMGGGIPHHIIVPLIEDLDRLAIQDFEITIKDDDHADSV